MKVRSLTPDDAHQVERLAGRHYPTSYRLSVEDVAENLQGVDDEDCNFCFGAFEERALVGYLMAWVDNSLIEGRAEDVVLVDDVVLNPEARGVLYRLLRAMVGAMEEAGCGGMPIEGTLRANAEETFVSHPEVIERLGYSLVASHKYRDETLGESLLWVRYEPAEDALSFLSVEDTYEVEESA